ncbi:hypothetical protein C265_09306 [Cupriavidus sp. GA3-3]|nr:hypothetical protein C265_09306 [Cupriavidus sp. GA3-3]
MRIPERIASLTLLGPTHDIADAFVRLGKRVSALTAEPDSLHRALANLTKRKEDFACFWELVQQILAVPRFADVYRSCHAERQTG